MQYGRNFLLFIKLKLTRLQACPNRTYAFLYMMLLEVTSKNIFIKYEKSKSIFRKLKTVDLGFILLPFCNSILVYLIHLYVIL